MSENTRSAIFFALMPLHREYTISDSGRNAYKKISDEKTIYLLLE
jgi:hypothetical protein